MTMRYVTSTTVSDQTVLELPCALTQLATFVNAARSHLENPWKGQEGDATVEIVGDTIVATSARTSNKPSTQPTRDDFVHEFATRYSQRHGIDSLGDIVGDTAEHMGLVRPNPSEETK